MMHLSRRRRHHRLQPLTDQSRSSEVDICSQMAIDAFSVVEERMKHAGLIINPAAAEFLEKPVEGLRLKKDFYFQTWFI